MRKSAPALRGAGRSSGDDNAASASVPRRYEFRSVVAGVETLSGHLSMARHHHSKGYATIVLGGSIREVSFAGRMSAGPGEVLLHGSFDCHLDRATGCRALQILRLPWQHEALEGQFQVRDPDSLARLAESDPQLASAELHRQMRPSLPQERYWVDDLATALARDSGFLLQEWARQRGLRPDAVSRVFKQEFGVSPKRFRLESRTRLAWREIVGSALLLTEIAFRSGFSDLAHLSRSIHIFTGRAPNAWRRPIAS